MNALKIVLVGDHSVGKTQFLYRHATNTFPTDIAPTVFDIQNEQFGLKNGQVAEIGLWDTYVSEDYERLRALSYPQTDAFIAMYSIGSHSSFENVTKKWYPEISYHCPGVPFIIVGTKEDLRGFHDAPVKVQEAEEVQRKIGAFASVVCSALTGEGIEEVIEKAIIAVMAQKEKQAEKHETSCFCIKKQRRK